MKSGAGTGLAAVDERQVLAGIGCLCLGLMFFSGQDAIMKLLVGDFSVAQLLMTRSLTTVPLLAGWLWWRHGRQGFASPRAGLHITRCGCVLVAFLCFYTAVSRVPLADVVALFGAAPLFITALAGPVLGETVGARRWSAVCVGFVGVLIMLRPGTQGFEPVSLLGAVAALAYATSALVTRRIGGSEPSGRLALYSNLAFVGGCGLLLAAATLFAAPQPGQVSPLWHPYVTPDPSELALMLAMGLVTLFGFILVPRAYQIAPASAITPFEYTYLLWAMLTGFVLFDEIPAATTWVGASLIVASGIYVAKREAAVAD